MDKEVFNFIEETAQKAADSAATTAVAKMREFHLDDLKVLGERMDAGFESVDRRFVELEERLDNKIDALGQRLDNKIDALGQRLDSKIEALDVRMDRVESALATILAEFKEDREKVRNLERQVIELTTRVKFLEEKLTTSNS